MPDGSDGIEIKDIGVSTLTRPPPLGKLRVSLLPMPARDDIQARDLPASNYPLSAAEARFNKGDEEIIAQITECLEKGITPSADVVEVLFCRSLEAMQSGYQYREGFTPPAIPWPRSSESVRRSEEKPSKSTKPFSTDEYLDRLREDVHHEYILKPNPHSKIFPNGIEAVYDKDDLLVFTGEVLSRLQPQEKEEVMRWAFAEGGIIDAPVDDFDLSDEILPELVDMFRNEGMEERARLVAPMMEYIYRNRQGFNYRLTEHHVDVNSRLDWIVTNLFTNPFARDFRPESLVYISSIPDDSKAKILLGMLVDERSFPEEINLVRRLIDETDLNVQTKARLERLGKMMLGVDPDDSNFRFHTSLNSVYRNLAFENYPVNQQNSPKLCFGVHLGIIFA